MKEVQRTTRRLRLLARTFFPRIGHLLRWTVRVMSPREAWYRGAGSGFTYSDQRQIRIHPDRTRVQQRDLDVLLLHELVHAAGYGGHGGAFLRRLRAVGRRARQLGMVGLAVKIAQEVDQYSGAEARTRAAAVYQDVVDVVDETGWSWARTRDALSQRYALLPKELVVRFPRARAVWQQAARMGRSSSWRGGRSHE